jgi:hypothetical protein
MHTLMIGNITLRDIAGEPQASSSARAEGPDCGDGLKVDGSNLGRVVGDRFSRKPIAINDQYRRKQVP